MSNNIYARVTTRLGGVALIFLAFGIIFATLTPSLFPPQIQSAVLINAIPFFAIFISILLTFILLIVLVAIRFNGKIPGRTYQSVEQLIVAGIVISIVFLFQSWSFIPYRYGFLLLLASTLSFIVWSHIVAPRADFDALVPKLTMQQHIVGAIAGVIVLMALISSVVSMNSPRPPYGLRERVYDSYTEERKAALAEEATSSFRNVELPFLIIFNVFPGLATYLIVRELVPGTKRRQDTEPRTYAAHASSS